MSMEFKVYQLPIAESLIEEDKDLALIDYIRGIGKVLGEHRYHYSITNDIDLTDHLLTFCFSEEYAPDINSVDDDNNSYIPRVNPYIITLMAIDLREKRFLVQNRDYPPQTLEKDQTLTRVSVLLNQAFQEVYHIDFSRITTDRTVHEDELLDLFNRYRISLLVVNIPNETRFIPRDQQIFEEDLQNINDNWIEGWNSDESGMSQVLLKAPGRGGDGDLRQSPIARSLVRMIGANIKQLTYWDEENRAHNISTETLKRFVVSDIDQRTLPPTAVDRVLTTILNNREELREYRAINDL